MDNRKDTLTRIVFAAVMAAMVYVVTIFRVPFLGSKIHFANAVCLLSGIFLGPVTGGLAAGIGSGLYDMIGGYGIIEALITFVSKFAMAWVCAKLIGREDKQPHPLARLELSCIAGQLTYVALYMLKTFIFQKFVYAYPMETVTATMISKLIPSLINALASVIVAPIFYYAVRPALNSSGILAKLRRSAS